MSGASPGPLTIAGCSPTLIRTPLLLLLPPSRGHAMRFRMTHLWLTTCLLICACCYAKLRGSGFSSSPDTSSSKFSSGRGRESLFKWEATIWTWVDQEYDSM